MANWCSFSPDEQKKINNLLATYVALEINAGKKIDPKSIIKQIYEGLIARNTPKDNAYKIVANTPAIMLKMVGMREFTRTLAPLVLELDELDIQIREDENALKGILYFNYLKASEKKPIIAAELKAGKKITGELSKLTAEARTGLLFTDNEGRSYYVYVHENMKLAEEAILSDAKDLELRLLPELVLPNGRTYTDVVQVYYKGTFLGNVRESDFTDEKAVVPKAAEKEPVKQPEVKPIVPADKAPKVNIEQKLKTEDAKEKAPVETGVTNPKEVKLKNYPKGSWAQVIQDAQDKKGIWVMRPIERVPMPENEHYGNPWSPAKERLSPDVIVVPNDGTAALNYKKWLSKEDFLDIQPERRDWILKQIADGVLDGKTLIYFKPGEKKGELGDYYSHADVLTELANSRRSVTRATEETINPASYTNHSGGAYGADTFWDIIGRPFGVVNHRHYRESSNAKLSKQLRDAGVKAVEITPEQLEEGYTELEKVTDKKYDRTLENNLKARNFFQVKNADAVYAIAQLATKEGKEIKSYLYPNIKGVTGGTNAAVQMAIAAGKPVYVWDLGMKSWFRWNGKHFEPTDTPVLTKNFAGIGSRDIEEYSVKKEGKWVKREAYKGKEIEDAAKKAIQDVYERTFGKKTVEPIAEPITGVKPVVTPTVSEGIEINSKQTGLGNDLTNVHYATNGKSKFDIKPSDTSLTLTSEAKRTWGESVEAWYKSNNAKSKGIPEGTEGDAYDMKLMIGLITDKLKQYPNLVTQITERGGLAFLDKSTHTMGTGRWSSKNPKNMFMNALKQAYRNVSTTSTRLGAIALPTIEAPAEGDFFQTIKGIKLDKNKNQKSMNEALGKDKADAAEKWYKNTKVTISTIDPKTGKLKKQTTTLAQLWDLKVVFNAINTENPHSVATFFDNQITLYKGSDFTDVYHEAWHGFTQSMLTEKQYNDLVAEVKSQKGSFVTHTGETVEFRYATPLEVEEYLAEEFRKYALSNGKHKLVGKVKQTLFEKILNWLKGIFSGVTKEDVLLAPMSVPMVNEMFNNLYTGKLDQYTFQQISSGKLFDKLVVDPNTNQEIFTVQEWSLVRESMDMIISMMLNEADVKQKEAFDNFITVIKGVHTDLMGPEKTAAPDVVKAGLVDFIKNNPGYSELLQNDEEEIAKFADKVMDPRQQDSLNPDKRYTHGLLKTRKGQNAVYAAVREKFYNDAVKATEEFNTKYADKELSDRELEQAYALKDKIDLLAKAVQAFSDNPGDLSNSKKGIVAAHRKGSTYLTYEEKYLTEDDEKPGEKVGEKKSQEKSFEDGATVDVKNLMRGLILYDGDKIVYNKLGYPKLVPSKISFYEIGTMLENSLDTDDMIRILTEHSTQNTIKGSLAKQILAKLGPADSPNPLVQGAWSSFTTSFFKTRINLRIAKVELETNKEGEVTGIIFKSSDASFINGEVERRFNDYIQSVPDAPFIKMNAKGINEIDAEAFVKKYYFLSTLESTKGQYLPKYKFIAGNPLEYLRDMGIIMTDNEAVRKALTEFATENNTKFFQLSNNILFSFLSQQPKSKLVKRPINSYYDLKKNQGSDFGRLVDIEIRHGDTTRSLMVETAEGEVNFLHSENSSLFNQINAINSPSVANIAELSARPGMQMFNPFTHKMLKGNIIFDSIFDKNGNRVFVNNKPNKIVLENYNGMQFTNANGQFGISSFELNELDRLFMDVETWYTKGFASGVQHEAKSSTYRMGAEHIIINGIKVKHYISPKAFTSWSNPNKRDNSLAAEEIVNLVVPMIERELYRVDLSRRIEKDAKSEDPIVREAAQNNPNYRKRVYGKRYTEVGSEFAAFADVLTKEVQNELKELNYADVEREGGLMKYLGTVPELKTKIRQDVKEYFISLSVEFAESVKNTFLPEGGSLDQLFSSNIDSKYTALMAFWVNDWIHKHELVNLFYGDIITYNHGKNEFNKRDSAFAGTKLNPRYDSGFIKYINGSQIFQKYINATDKMFPKQTVSKVNKAKALTTIENNPFDAVYNAAIFEDPVTRSIYYETYFKHLTREIMQKSNVSEAEAKKIATIKLKEYTEMKEADAQGWITLPAYRIISEGIGGKWSKEQNDLYNQILEGNIQMGVSEFMEFFPIKKMQMSGPLMNEDGGIALYAFHKFSLLPLVPGLINDNSVLKSMHDRMIEQNVHYSLMASGSKLGNYAPIGKTADSFYVGNVNDRISEFKNPEYKFTINKVHSMYFGEQVATGEYFKKKVTFSTQLKKLAEIGLYEFGIPKDYKPEVTNLDERASLSREWEGLDETEKEKYANYRLAKEYIKAIENLEEKLKAEVREEFGLDENYNPKSTSRHKIYDKIRETLIRKNYSDVEISSIIPGKDLSTTPNAKDIERVVMNIVNKKILNPKLKGEALILASSTGFELELEAGGYRPNFANPTEEDLAKYGSKDLASYTPRYDKKGNLIGINAMKVKIALQGDFKKLLDHADVIKRAAEKGIDRVSALNELIKEDWWLDQPISGESADRNLYPESAVYAKAFARLESKKGDSKIFVLKSDLTPALKKELVADTKKGKRVKGKQYFGINILGDFYSHKTIRSKDGDLMDVIVVDSVEDAEKQLQAYIEGGAKDFYAVTKLVKGDKKQVSGRTNRDLITLTGVRIPVQGPNSMEVMEVWEFLPEDAGNIIIPPLEIVAKAGSDFDIDKLTVLMPSIINYNGSVELVPSKLNVPESFDSLRNAIKSAKRNIRLANDTYDVKFEDLQNKGIVKLSVSQRNELSKLKTNKDKALELLDNKIAQATTEEEIEDLENQKDSIKDKYYEFNKELYYSFIDTIPEVKTITKERDLTIQYAKNEIEDYQRKLAAKGSQGAQNRVLQILNEVILRPDNFSGLYLPNGKYLLEKYAKGIDGETIALQDYVREYDLRKGFRGTAKGGAIIPTKVFEYRFQETMRNSNNIGMSALGIGATENTINVAFNKVGMYVNPASQYSRGRRTIHRHALLFEKYNKVKATVNLSVKEKKDFVTRPFTFEDAISLASLRDAKYIDEIAEIISQFITGYVDIAKDAWVFDLQADKFIAPTLFFMIQAGVPVKEAVYFVSQPIVREYIRTKKNLSGLRTDVFDHTASGKYWENEREARIRMVQDRYFADKFTERGISVSENSDTLEVSLFMDEGMTNVINAHSNNPKALTGLDVMEKKIIENADKSKMTQNDVDTLIHFMHIEDMANGIGKIKNNLAFDTKLGTSFYDILKKESKLEKLEANKFIPDGMLDKLMKETAQGVINPGKLAIDMFGKTLLPFRTDERLLNYVSELINGERAISTGRRKGPRDRSINNDDVIRRTTVFEDPQAAYTEFINQLIPFIFQNTLSTMNTPNSISGINDKYKGYEINTAGKLEDKKEFAVRATRYVKLGAWVKDGVIYLDRDILGEQFKGGLYTTGRIKDLNESIAETGIKLSPVESSSYFLTEDDYVRFVIERELTRSLYDKPEKYEKLYEYTREENRLKQMNAIAPLESRISNEELYKMAYENFIRDKALSNTYNFNYLFKGANSYADRYMEIKALVEKEKALNPNLKEYTIFDFLSRSIIMASKPTFDTTIKTLAMATSTMTSDEVTDYNDQLSKLQNNSIVKFKNKDLNNYVSDFFKQFSIYAYLQSGSSGVGRTNLNKLIGHNTTVQALLEKPKEYIDKQLDDNILAVYTNRFYNVYSKDNARNSFGVKDWRLNNENAIKTLMKKGEDPKVTATEYLKVKYNPEIQKFGEYTFPKYKLTGSDRNNTESALKTISEKSNFMLVYEKGLSKMLQSNPNFLADIIPDNTTMPLSLTRGIESDYGDGPVLIRTEEGYNKMVALIDNQINNLVSEMVNNNRVPIFNSEGYGQQLINPPTTKSLTKEDIQRLSVYNKALFDHLSSRLFKEFGYQNPGYYLSEVSTELIENFTPVSDKDVREFITKCYKK